ncbi:MAG: carbon-nitrogen hydrolase family protein [Deltaproteobacteria bacterium]|nr:carbon-nitrogen hydrolase family protein [Deltaproteobacteria bacterium]
MTEYTQFKLAAIQAEPVYFDLEASTEKACRLIREAGAGGATLAAFGESWLPGYPFFVWGSATGSMAAEYLANAVEIPGAATDRLCEAARQAHLDVVMGLAERDPQTQGTVYCTLLFIDHQGTILGKHRKLKPTHRERTAWGEGDGSGLNVYDRPYARISGLNCWEHNMVLPGYVLMARGTQIHVAAWPGMNNSRHLFLSRAFASQAGAYVIDVGAVLSPDRVSDAYRDLAVPYPGESCIIDPRGEVIAGPAEGETILLADCSIDRLYSAKALCDVAGHYSRPDLFQLSVNRSAYNRVVSRPERKFNGEQGTALDPDPQGNERY